MPVASFKAYTVTQAPWSYTYVLDERHDLVAMTAMSLDRTRVHEDLSLDKAEIKSVGARRVLWIQTKDTSSETQPNEDDTMDDSGDERVAVTLCVLGDDKMPTRCPLRDVPLSHHTWHEAAAGAGEDKDPHRTESTTVVDLALGSDGTATVKLVSGPSDHALDAVMGPHALW